MQSELHSFHEFDVRIIWIAALRLSAENSGGPGRPLRGNKGSSTAIVLVENIGFETRLSLLHFQQVVTTFSQDAAKVERTAVFLFFNCSTSASDSVDEARFRSR